MSIESIKRSVLFSLIVMIAMHAPCQAKSGADEVAAAGLIVAGVGVAVAGVASVFGWATSQSDESYLETAQEDYHSLLKKYNRYYGCDSYDRGCLHIVRPEHLESVGAVHEAYVYEVALLFSSHALKARDHSRELRALLSTISDHRAELTQRIKKSYKTADSFRSTIEKMRILRDSIGSLEGKISALLSFYTRHSCYFELFDYEMWMMKRYERELCDHRHNIFDGFQEDIGRYQITREYRKYPFVFYVECLEKDLRLFKKLINKASPYYGERVRAAQNLYNTLYDLKNRVERGRGYASDVRQKEDDEREAKRLALMQEQLDVRKQEMRILEKQAQLKRQEVERQERALRRQRKQSSGEHTANISAHVHVHI